MRADAVLDPGSARRAVRDDDKKKTLAGWADVEEDVLPPHRCHSRESGNPVALAGWRIRFAVGVAIPACAGMTR